MYYCKPKEVKDTVNDKIFFVPKVAITFRDLINHSLVDDEHSICDDII